MALELHILAGNADRPLRCAVRPACLLQFDDDRSVIRRLLLRPRLLINLAAF